ncbi:MAG: hypothetical protein BV456_13050 [Thermoplasmata archaeon M8B2D]|nr:MAG: hypothetical protein BV456_13050 [Thermoplasmata archaeon M8B2D]
MTTLAINYPAKNESNPYESTTFIPYTDKLSNVVEFTGTYRKDGSPKIRHRYSPSDIKVYGSLMRRTRGQKNSRVHPKIQTIADDCNCSYGTVQRSLSKLENDLVIFIRRTGRASHYFFVPLQADGTPDENSGEYQTAKALLARKKSHSDLANCELSYNSKEIKNPIGVFLSQPEKQLAARRAALLSMVPKGLRLSLAILKLWINVALKYFADDAELVLKRTFESEKPSAYFWKVYQEKIKNPDIKKPQSSPTLTLAKSQKNNTNKRDNIAELNFENTKILHIFTGKIYVADSSGSIEMDDGYLPRVRVEKAIQDGKFKIIES